MELFAHRHYWREQHSITIVDKDGTRNGVLILEYCGCGAKRTITVAPNKPPVTRDGVTEPTHNTGD